MLASSFVRQHRYRGKVKMDGICPWCLNQLCAGGAVVKDTCIINDQGFQKGIADLGSLGSGRPMCDLCRVPASLKKRPLRIVFPTMSLWECVRFVVSGVCC